MSAQSPLQLVDPISNEPIEISNPGQFRIYQLRKAYREGTFFASNDLPPEIQARLNQPEKIQSQQFTIDPLDQLFLQDLLKKVEQGVIKLFTPSSLLNLPVYENLEPEMKAKAEFDILILAHKIREIKKLWDAGYHDSYQLYNVVHSLRLTKERLEQFAGDIFII